MFAKKMTKDWLAASADVEIWSAALAETSPDSPLYEEYEQRLDDGNKRLKEIHADYLACMKKSPVTIAPQG